MVVLIEKNILLKLLRKSVLYRLMDNIDNLLISKSNLTHRELSNLAGNSNNWFNDAYNNNEDIQITSFVKVLSVVNQKKDLSNYKLMSIFDEKILKIMSLFSRLTDEEDNYIEEFIIAEKTLFMDIIGDWASMEYKNKLNAKEIDVMNEVKDLVSHKKEEKR